MSSFAKISHATTKEKYEIVHGKYNFLGNLMGHRLTSANILFNKMCISLKIHSWHVIGSDNDIYLIGLFAVEKIIHLKQTLSTSKIYVKD